MLMMGLEVKNAQCTTTLDLWREIGNNNGLESVFNIVLFFKQNKEFIERTRCDKRINRKWTSSLSQTI
jgi:hypothetical protein